MPIAGKLGKLAPKPHAFSLTFEHFLGAEPLVPNPSSKRAWEYVIADSAWGMFDNDRIGNCTCASKAHIIMAVTANQGSLFTPTVEQVDALYSAVTGYDPSQTQENGYNPTDNGAVMTDVYDYIYKNGFAGRKLLGWVKIDHTNRIHFEQCVELFGACDTGVQLPNSAMQQFNADQNWDIVADDGGIDGGHCVPYLGYGSLGETCITWAHRQPCGIPWFQKYCDEAYGLIWEDWFDTTDVAPNHFKKDELWNALQALKV